MGRQARGLRGNLRSGGNAVYAIPLPARETYGDQANRLISATVGTTTTQYAYNADGARLQQVVNGSPTTYTLDLAAPLVQVLTQQDADGETAYLYGVTRIGEQQPGGWAYHLSDALGSVRQLADVGGQVTLALATRRTASRCGVKAQARAHTDSLANHSM